MESKQSLKRLFSLTVILLFFTLHPLAQESKLNEPVYVFDAGGSESNVFKYGKLITINETYSPEKDSAGLYLLKIHLKEPT